METFYIIIQEQLEEPCLKMLSQVFISTCSLLKTLIWKPYICTQVQYHSTTSFTDCLMDLTERKN